MILTLPTAETALVDGLAAPDLRSRISFPAPLGQFTVGPGILIKAADGGFVAEFLLWDSADSIDCRMPFRALLRADLSDQRWRITAIESQCPSCFGVGVLDDDGPRLCDTCGATGWGVAEVIERTGESQPAIAPDASAQHLHRWRLGDIPRGGPTARGKCVICGIEQPFENWLFATEVAALPGPSSDLSAVRAG